MSDIRPPNELYTELRDQLVDDDVDTIKAYLRKSGRDSGPHSGLFPRQLEMCKTFTDICYKLEEKGEIKPNEDDYTFLEKMFHFLKMMTLKDKVTKFAADCRQSRKLQASEHTVIDQGASASKDKDYADPDKYRNDGRGHYRSSGRPEQVEASNEQGGTSSAPNATGGGQAQGSSN